ncbi:MAG TPA: glycosyltransferase family 39 protein [Anaerolineales bacterium]
MADLLSVGGVIVYTWLLWKLAHNQLSVLDEGLYLFKGWLFATGRLAPFQPYGAWTNQMPLAFLIPGWVELLFGAGLRTGRMLAVILGLLMLVGLWLTARRLAGRWVAAGLVMALLLNPAAARMYALAASQGLVACLLAWTLWFSLGAERRGWQWFMGGLLAGAAVMVRINLLALLPLLALYVLWAGGWKSFCWSLGGMLLIFGGLHLLYWPNILTLWAKWLPFGFLRPWFPPKTIPTWAPDNPPGFRVASFFLAFRYHFAALAGGLVSWVFWPDKARLKTGVYQAAVFLSFLLVVFFLMHAWASLGNEYCVFCFPTYTAFYAGVGLLLAALTLPAWKLDPPLWRKWLGAALFLVLLGGMAYSAEGAAENALGGLFYKRLLAVPVPGLNGALVWQVLANKFRLEYSQVYGTAHAWFPILLAVLFGLVLLGAAAISARASGRVRWGWGLVVLLAAGSLLAPAPVLAGDYTTYDCSTDVIAAYEAAGARLAKSIPPGSKIYWAGYSPASLLYLPDVKIYPAQLHGAYSFRISTDDDALLKYGWWNENLAQKWLGEADFVLAEQKNLGKNDWLGAGGRLASYDLVTSTQPLVCQADPLQGAGEDTSAMLLFRRK